MLSLFLILLSQVSVTSTWLVVSQADVDKVLTPLTNRFSSYANVIITFASVIIVVWFIKLLSRKFNKKLDKQAIIACFLV